MGAQRQKNAPTERFRATSGSFMDPGRIRTPRSGWGPTGRFWAHKIAFGPSGRFRAHIAVSGHWGDFGAIRCTKTKKNVLTGLFRGHWVHKDKKMHFQNKGAPYPSAWWDFYLRLL